MGILWELFTTFLKLGTIAYGGGPAMIPVIQSETVEGHEWLSDDEFRTGLAIGYGLPGPIAPKMAFFVGFQTYGVIGGLVAMFGVLLPNVFAMFLLTTLFFGSFSEGNKYLDGAAKGASIGVVGLLAYVAYNQAHKIFARNFDNGWLGGLAAHPDWVILVIVIFVAAVWRPTLMIPLGLVGAAIYGALFLR